MRLYAADYAPNPRRVLWVMAEKAISDIEVVPLDIMTHAHKSEPGIAVAGQTSLPVLELDDGTRIAESLAIARYLESLYPEPNLFGRDARETAAIEMWTRRVELQMANPIMLTVRMTAPFLAVLETPNPEVGAYYRDLAGTFAKALDAHLAHQDFIAAGRFTIADIVAVTALDFARLIRFRPDRELPNLARWLTDMRARSAVPKAG